jgi:DNA replication protein DnaC
MLEAAQRQGRYHEVKHRAVNAYKLLIVDEICYLPLSREATNLFFQIVERRYERATMILTSNLAFGSWDLGADEPCASPLHARSLSTYASNLRLVGGAQ